MKQHITGEDWSQFERSNKTAADKLRGYYAKYKKKYIDENYPGEYVNIEWEPIFIWFDIGQMIEFLDENEDPTDRVLAIERTQEPYFYDEYDNGWDDMWTIKDRYNNPTKQELCDALWEACREILECE